MYVTIIKNKGVSFENVGEHGRDCWEERAGRSGLIIFYLKIKLT